jgi:hypothetical protein
MRVIGKKVLVKQQLFGREATRNMTELFGTTGPLLKDG